MRLSSIKSKFSGCFGHSILHNAVLSRAILAWPHVFHLANAGSHLKFQVCHWCMVWGVWLTLPFTVVSPVRYLSLHEQGFLPSVYFWMAPHTMEFYTTCDVVVFFGSCIAAVFLKVGSFVTVRSYTECLLENFHIFNRYSYLLLLLCYHLFPVSPPSIVFIVSRSVDVFYDYCEVVDSCLLWVYIGPLARLLIAGDFAMFRLRQGVIPYTYFSFSSLQFNSNYDAKLRCILYRLWVSQLICLSDWSVVWCSWLKLTFWSSIYNQPNVKWPVQLFFFLSSWSMCDWWCICICFLILKRLI
jgi:hypothetical protein